MYLVTGGAYFCGVWFLAMAVAQLKKVADYRSMMYHPVEIKGAALQVIVGISLIYLPTLFTAATKTVWGTVDIMRYGDQASGSEFDEVISICFDILKLIGVFAFIRGLFILSKLGESGGQHGGLGKAITHMAGGLVAYHLYSFLVIMEATLGISILP